MALNYVLYNSYEAQQARLVAAARSGFNPTAEERVPVVEGSCRADCLSEPPPAYEPSDAPPPYETLFDAIPTHECAFDENQERAHMERIGVNVPHDLEEEIATRRRMARVLHHALYSKAATLRAGGWNLETVCEAIDDIVAKSPEYGSEHQVREALRGVGRECVAIASSGSPPQLTEGQRRRERRRRRGERGFEGQVERERRLQRTYEHALTVGWLLAMLHIVPEGFAMDTSAISLIGGRYDCRCHLGSGTCGIVHAGVDIFTNKDVAIKFEPDSQDHRLLEHEATVYEHLAGCPYVPSLHWFGSDYECDVLVMDLLGPSLETLLTQRGRMFPVKTVLIFGINLLHALESFHDHGYLHRDLKPANIATSFDTSSPTLYLIDLGLAQRYHLSDGQHVSATARSAVVGTTRFCSARAHESKRQSRRDDLESLAYVLVRLLGGSLPWANMKTTREVYRTKLRTRPSQLCKGFPPAFSELLLYARHLEFADRPDYAMLRNLLERDLALDYHQDDAACATMQSSGEAVRQVWGEDAPFVDQVRSADSALEYSAQL